MVRRPWVGGNWKCNGSIASMKVLAEELNSTEWDASSVDVVIAPPSVYVVTVQSLLNEKFIVCSQNISLTGNGAYTGEVSGDMLKDLDVHWTLIGHSERRQRYGETNSVVAGKVKTAEASGLYSAVCIGEVLEEREAGKTDEVLKEQVLAFIPSVSDWSRIVIAYEPVWAIGTGKVATPDQAQSAHEVIRATIAENVSSDVAQAVRIVYGGSVTAANCDELAAKPDVDGFLVGGASLKPEFKKIIGACVNRAKL